MLEKVSLFSNLKSDLLSKLEQYASRRTYPKNTILFMEGDHHHYLYVVESGKVKVFLNGDDGKEVILNFLGPEDYFGELALIDNKPRSASVMTVSECVFLSISPEDFRRCLEENPGFGMDVMCSLVGRIRELTDSVKDMALLDVYGRVAHQLRRHADENGRIANPKLTHQEIANMVGSSREMVSRIMKELVKGEFVEQNTDSLVIKKNLPPGW